MIFHADSESDLKTTPNQVKTRFYQKSDFYPPWAAASAEGLLNPPPCGVWAFCSMCGYKRSVSVCEEAREAGGEGIG